MKTRRQASPQLSSPQQDVDQGAAHDGASLGAPAASPDAMSAAQGAYGNAFLTQLARESGQESPSAPGALPYRAELEAAFGEDFSSVTAWLGERDVLSGIDARAAASGESVAFAEASPDRALVAHELTHVVQQRQSGGAVQASGLSRSGDAAEREADAVGDAVGAGQTAPAIAAAPAAGIQREEETLENDVDVREGEGTCFELGDDAESLIDAFILSAHDGIGAWAAIREGSDLDFDDSALDQQWLDFQTDWVDLSSNTVPTAFRETPEAWDEASRRLNSGTTPQYVQEIRMFNGGALHGYAELLGVEEDIQWHHYDLITVVAVSGGGGEGVTVEAAVASYEIRYSNTIGMSWSQNTQCGSVGAGFGLGTPVSVNVESSLGDTDINAGSADTITYYAPDFFDAALLGYVAGDALGGGGVGIGAVQFSNLDDTITFDTTGLIARAGTDVVGKVGGSTGGGVCANPTTDDGVDLDEASPVEEAPREGEWEPLIEAAIFFPTGDAALDADDVETVKAVAAAAVEHERASRGDIFRVLVVGSASNRWRGETGEDSPEELNEALAGDRAEAVEAALDVELSELSHEFTQGVFDESKMLALTRDSSAVDPDDNNQIDRSVYIRILYNPCGADGNVGQ